MTPPDWRRQGHLTPDAPEAQRELWALGARLRGHLALTLSELSQRSAEPSWSASLTEGAERARELSLALSEEAGEEARLVVADDPVYGEFEQALEEVLGSGHVPSLVVTGYAVLGELARAPFVLLDEVAGPHAGLLCGRLLSCQEHHVLGRLAPILHLDDASCRRLLRHLNTGLHQTFRSWSQTLHTLGVDGELLVDQSRDAASRALGELGLEASRADLKVFTV